MNISYSIIPHASGYKLVRYRGGFHQDTIATGTYEQCFNRMQDESNGTSEEE